MGTGSHLSGGSAAQLWGHRPHGSGGCLCPDSVLGGSGAETATHADRAPAGSPSGQPGPRGPGVAQVGWGRPALCARLGLAFFARPPLVGFGGTTHSCEKSLSWREACHGSQAKRPPDYLWKACVCERYWFLPSQGTPSLGGIPSFVMSPGAVALPPVKSLPASPPVRFLSWLSAQRGPRQQSERVVVASSPSASEAGSHYTGEM